MISVHVYCYIKVRPVMQPTGPVNTQKCIFIWLNYYCFQESRRVRAQQQVTIEEVRSDLAFNNNYYYKTQKKIEKVAIILSQQLH